MKLHELEALANEICEEQQTKVQKMCRLIRAYARIIYARQPGEFSRMPCHYGDEAGHWDNSYPPKQKYTERSGPLSIKVIQYSSEDVATGDGFYYSYRTVPTDPGLYVTPAGNFIGGDMAGTGRLGQFAAHPGDCDVDCTITWRDLSVDDIPFDRLQKAESELRKLAFPLIAARLAAAKEANV